MASEAFRFVSIRPPQAASEGTRPLLAFRADPDTPFARAVREHRQPESRAKLREIVAGFVKSMQFVDLPRKIESSLPQFYARLMALPERGFQDGAHVAFSESFAIEAARLEDDATYSAVKRRIGDSILAASIDPSVTASVRTFLIGLAVASAVITALSVRRKLNKSDLSDSRGIMTSRTRSALVFLVGVLLAVPAASQGVPYPPNGLAAQVSGNDVTLTWNAGSGASTYVVEVGSGHGLSDIGPFVTGPATTFSAAGVPAGIYYVRVRGRNAAGDSGATNEVTLAVGITCQLPAATGLVADVVGNTVSLSWTGTNATGYRLEVGPSPGSSAYDDLALGAAMSIAAVVAPGTYYARVRGENACGLGMPSNEAAIAVGVPAAPGDLRGSVIGDAVTLRWTVSTSPGVTGYVLGLGSAPGAFDLGYTNVGAVTSYTTTGVPVGTYAVRVQAVSAGGLGPLSNELAVTVGPPPPGTAVVTFSSLPGSGTPFVIHAEAGLVVEAIAGPWVSGPSIISTRAAGTGPVDSEVRVRSAAPATFQLVSVRLYSSVTPIPYVFRGVRNGVTVYTASGTVPNTFGAYATVPNPFATTAVDEVFITVTNPATPTCATCGNPVGLDDIVVRP